ncbi:peptidase domain-containing ABC transporter [Endozoicomonas lisbonensis]|uniref:ATP-binding cassette subfamily C protein LapB n=1 Tax=Endozoicomonas lisbonensis TaxID=3120522 RepID=A0ABV2SNW5_9GAMM
MPTTEQPFHASSLSDAFLTLVRLSGADLSAEVSRELLLQGMDVRQLQQRCERFGLTCQRSLSALGKLPETAFPCLLQMKGKRFVVALAARQGELQVLDKQGQPVWIKESVIGSRFSGVCYAIHKAGEPDARIPATAFGWLKREASQLWANYAQVIVATLLINCLTLAVPVFTHFVFDKVLPNYATETLVAVTIGIGLVILADFVLRWLRSFYIDDACRHITRQAELQLIDSLLRQEAHQVSLSPARLAQQAQSFSRVKEALSSSILLTALDIPFFILFTAVIGLIGGPLMWVPIAVAAVLVPASIINYRLTRKRSSIATTAQTEKNACLHELTQGLETIRAMGAGQSLLSRWRVLVNSSNRHDFSHRRVGSVLNAFVISASQIVVVATLVIGVFLIQSGQLAPGSLFACIILGSRAVAPLMNLTQLLSRINLSRQALRQLDLLFANSPTETTDGEKQRLYHLIPTIEFKDLSFRYPSDNQDTLQGINLSISAGERVAVVGASGSGKTTLIRLLSGDLIPDSGRVSVSGHDLAGLHLADVRQHLSVLHQQPFVFSGTLRSNLLLGNASANTAELDRACFITGLDQWVSRCRKGYEHPIGECGSNLSGGQKQALCLSRTLLHSGSLLVLDEPTSAMDNLSEAQFCQRLPDYLSEDQTLLLVTHRASLLQLVDRIIVLAHGRVVADGARDEILKKMQAVRTS